MISVIIPLYNKEAIVKRSIESVLSQNYEDFEIIVVNDGSTDKSAEIVRKIKDSRVRLIEQTNGGPSKARNTGVKNARGEWILFIDADDELLPGAISNFAKYIEKEPTADMLLAEVVVNNAGNKKLSRTYQDGYAKNPFKAYVFSQLYQCSGTTVYRKSICLQYPFDERVRRFEDLQRLFELYRHFNLYFCHVRVAQVNVEYSSASRARKNIKEDFLGYLDFKGKSFWEKMALFSFFLGERDYYGEQCKKLYPWLYRRYDWMLINKIIGWMK